MITYNFKPRNEPSPIACSTATNNSLFHFFKTAQTLILVHIYQWRNALSPLSQGPFPSVSVATLRATTLPSTQLRSCLWRAFRNFAVKARRNEWKPSVLLSPITFICISPFITERTIRSDTLFHYIHKLSPTLGNVRPRTLNPTLTILPEWKFVIVIVTVWALKNVRLGYIDNDRKSLTIRFNHGITSVFD